MTEWEDDILLFVHLIPVCQYHQTFDSSPKIEFEEEVSKRSSKYGNRIEFLNYLFSYPANNSLRQFSHKNDNQVSWELIFMLIRNIFCHEYNYDWRDLHTRLTPKLIEFFNSKDEFWTLLCLYNDLVMPKPTSDKHPKLFHSSNWSSHLSEISSDIILYSALIPCRSNNSIVDDSFEHEMQTREKNYGNYETFASYLRTHPANKHQTSICLDDISWVMIIRNVFCHEQSFDLSSLKEFSEYVEMYFGSRDEFAAMIELYKAKCRGSLKNENIASIQLTNSVNCCIIEGNLFVGVFYVELFVEKEGKKFFLEGNNVPIVWVFGSVGTGKSVVARRVLPSVIQSRFYHKTVTIYFVVEFKLNSTTAEERIDEFEKLVVKGKLRELIVEITERDNLVITIDNFENLLVGLELSEKFLVLDYFENIIKEFNHCCVWIITGNFTLPWLLHVLYSQSNRTKHKILSQGAIYETLLQSAEEDLKDYQRLLRHYYDIDKYKLRDAIHNKFLNCAYLSKIAAKLSASSDPDINSELSLTVNKTLDWLKSNKEEELIDFMVTSPETPMKGRLAKYLNNDDMFIDTLKLYINESK